MTVCGITGYYMFKLPDNYYVQGDSDLVLSCNFEITAQNMGSTAQALSTQTQPLSKEVELRLFGIIPIKTVNIQSVDKTVLVPGGNPFGILLQTEGVMVVSLGEVDTSDGLICPASDAGIKTGDIVLKINNKKISSNSDIQEKIASSDGEAVTVLLRRDEKEISLQMTPAYSVNAGSYKAGMYVRDSCAGIGTVTFYDPATGIFGGLGHPVCDVDTGNVMTISSGEVVGVSINGVNKGSAGKPGELVGSFTSRKTLGSLNLNEFCGLFGRLSTSLNYNSAIPMGLKQEVNLGEATILSTVDGSTPKEYSIEIEKIDYRDKDNSKNFVIRITDAELIELTGGIVQGMSGSPIIQNGQLVGAVTHVFVNDPTRGYGIFCETMYENSKNVNALS